MALFALAACEDKSATPKPVATAPTATASASARKPAPRPHGRFEIAYAIYTAADAKKAKTAAY